MDMLSSILSGRTFTFLGNCVGDFDSRDGMGRDREGKQKRSKNEELAEVAA